MKGDQEKLQDSIGILLLKLGSHDSIIASLRKDSTQMANELEGHKNNTLSLEIEELRKYVKEAAGKTASADVLRKYASRDGDIDRTRLTRSADNLLAEIQESYLIIAALMAKEAAAQPPASPSGSGPSSKEKEPSAKECAQMKGDLDRTIQERDVLKTRLSKAVTAKDVLLAYYQVPDAKSLIEKNVRKQGQKNFSDVFAQMKKLVQAIEQ